MGCESSLCTLAAHAHPTIARPQATTTRKPNHACSPADLVAQIGRVGSTPYQIMQRSRKITRFMADFRRTGGVGVLDGARAGEGCSAPSLLHSK